MAIARAVAEHIHSSPELGCKTLFATHYHEMTELADLLPRAVNYQVSVADEDGEIVFLHRIVEGGADRSYGVHVGRIAGLPAPVISRAWELLDQLESSRPQRVNGKVQGMQLQLTEPDDDLNVDEMTPVQAISKLYELQQEALRERG
jgi:DNA mismatch repair protein MutS